MKQQNVLVFTIYKLSDSRRGGKVRIWLCFWRLLSADELVLELHLDLAKECQSLQKVLLWQVADVDLLDAHWCTVCMALNKVEQGLWKVSFVMMQVV
jgi:hypothetical protein